MSTKRLFSISILALSTTIIVGSMAYSAPRNGGVFGAQRGHRCCAGMSAGRGAQKLNLTDDQKSRIKSIVQGAREQIKSIRGNASLTPAAKRDQIKTIRERVRDQIKKVLTPEQQKQMAQMRHGRGDMAGVMAQRLGLSASQKNRIKSIMESRRTQTMAVMSDKSLSPDARRSEIREIRQSTREQIAQVLTPEQLQKFRSSQRAFNGGWQR